MNKKFSYFLQSVMDEKSSTSLEVVAKLNLFHPEFSDLDTVTYSRWLNGKTKPSYKKQIMICVFFDFNVLKFIESYVSVSGTSKSKTQIYKYFSNLKTSPFNTSAGAIENSNYNLDVMKISEYKKQYRDHLAELASYRFVDENLSNLKVYIGHNRVSLSDKHYSFLPFSITKEDHSSLFGLSESFSNMDYIVHFPLAKIISYESYRNIMAIVLREILNTCDILNSVVVKTTKTTDNFNLFRKLGFSLCGFETANDIKIYHMKISMLDFFSSHYVLDLLVNIE